MRKKGDIFKWNNWVAFTILSLTWGTSFILIKKSLVAFDSTQVASLRILIATLAFVPVLILNIKKIDWSKWYLYLFVGLIGSGIPSFLFSLAQTKISSGLAGSLNTITPIFTLIFAVIMLKKKIDSKKIVGVFIGLFGAGLIIYNSNSSFEGGYLYSSLIILATVLYALNVNFVKKYFNTHDPVQLTAASFIFFGPLTIIILLKTDFVSVLQSNPDAMMSLGAVTLLSLFSTVFATVLFFKLVQKSNTIFASSVSFSIPLVAMFWGIIDGEHFTLLHVISLVAILLGVYLTRSKK